MKDIEPNPHLNKIAAGLIGIMALSSLLIAYDNYTLMGSSEWPLAAVFVGMGSILLLHALRLLRSSPMNAARLRFRSDGFRLETKQVFRGSKVVELDWADVTTVTLHDASLYGGRSIKVVHGPAGDVAMFAPAWTNCSSEVVIDRLQASAEASGYMFEKETGGWRSLTRKRWTVTQKT